MARMKISLQSHEDACSNNVLIEEGRDSITLSCKDAKTSITFDQEGVHDLITALQLVYKRM